MPNYIKNRLSIIGTDEQIKEIKEFLKPKEKTSWDDQNESVALDFNNITPMPKWVYRGGLTHKEEEKYGVENCWYEWSIKNWGTKWNAFRTSEKDNIIEFETAWAGVPELMAKLAVIFPNAKFIYEYADEDSGYNVGSYIFEDTTITQNYLENGSKKAYELYFDLWGNNENFKFNKSTGTYEYIEEE